MAEYVDIEEVKKDHQMFLGYLDQDMINRLNLTLEQNVQRADVVERSKVDTAITEMESITLVMSCEEMRDLCVEILKRNIGGTMNNIDCIIADIERDDTVISGCTTKGEVITLLQSLKIQQENTCQNCDRWNTHKRTDGACYCTNWHTYTGYEFYCGDFVRR